jgi:hypothetical protein
MGTNVAEGLAGWALDDPEVKAAVDAVSTTHQAWRKAVARFNRCRNDGPREAARGEMDRAERVYRDAAEKRDSAVALWRARKTQRGEPR